MQDKNEIFKHLVEALSPLLGNAAKTIVAQIIEKLEHSNNHHSSNTQESRVVTQNGYTKILPLHPINNPHPQANVKFNEIHKLGNHRPVHTNKEATQTYNYYQQQADTHKKERHAGDIQRRIKTLEEHNNNETRFGSFFRR